MAEKSLVLAVSRYDFVPDGGNERLKGTKVVVLESTVHKKADKMGSLVAEMSADYEVFEQFQGQPLPGYYELDLAVTGASKGKVGVKVTGGKFVAPFAGAAPAPALKAA